MLLNDMVVELQKLKERKKELEDAAGEVQEQIDRLKEDLTDELIGEGLQSIKIQGVGTVYLEVQQFPKIEDKEKFFKYLEDTDQQEMIKVTVDHNTLRGWWKQQLVELNPEDLGLVIFKKTDVKLRKS